MRASLALVSVACSSRLVPAKPENLSLEIAFAVVAEGELPISVSDPFPIAGGFVTEGSPVHVEADLDRQDVLLIGLDRESLLVEVPAYDDRRGSPRLVIEAPPSSAVEDETARRTKLRLPGGARIHRLEGDRFVGEADRRIVERLTLDVPYDPEVCDPRYDVSVAASFPPKESRFHDDFIDVGRLSDGRIVALARGALYLFEGGALTSSVTFVPPRLAPFAQATSFAIERSASPRVHVAFEVKDDVRILGGEIVTYAIGVELALVETATSSARTAYYDVAIDGEGRLLAVGTAGRAIFRRSGSRSFEDAPALDVVRDLDGQQVRPVDGPLGPHYAASPNRLYLGDVTAGASFDDVATTTGEKLDVVDLAASPAALWAVTRPAAVFIRRSSDARFAELALDIDADFLACAEGSGQLPAEIAAIGAVDGGAIVVGSCDAFLFVREDGCTATIRLPGREVRLIPNDDGAIEVSADFITIGGAAGEIWELSAR